MRSVPDDFDPATVAAIDARLVSIAVEHGVRSPWAIESGSRAWGFASPDSDYDCRFFFVRTRAHDDAGVPPMNLDELLTQADVPDGVREEIEALRAVTARTRELGSASVPPAIARWVLATFAAEPDQPSPPGLRLRAEAEAGFRELVGRWAPEEG